MSEGPLYPDHATLWEANTYLCSHEGCDIYSGAWDDRESWVYVVRSLGNRKEHVTYMEDHTSGPWHLLPASVQELVRAHFQLLK